MSARRSLVPAELAKRYTELKDKLSAASEAEPLDWAGHADAQEQLETVCQNIAVALHRANEPVLGRIASDQSYAYSLSARESRRIAAERAGGAR